MTITLRGTSHIASNDIGRIGTAVGEHRPAVVAVELDPLRLHALRHGDTGHRPGSPLLLAMKLLQQLLARRTGVAPGSDMLAAVEAAEAGGIPVALIDRDIRVTLHRLQAVPLIEKVKFAGFLLLSPFLLSGTDIDLAEVPDDAVVQEMLERFRIGFPRMHTVLVDERDAVMAERLAALEAEYGDVLAFVGAGHRAGIGQRLGTEPS